MENSTCEGHRSQRIWIYPPSAAMVVELFLMDAPSSAFMNDHDARVKDIPTILSLGRVCRYFFIDDVPDVVDKLKSDFSRSRKLCNCTRYNRNHYLKYNHSKSIKASLGSTSNDLSSETVNVSCQEIPHPRPWHSTSSMRKIL